LANNNTLNQIRGILGSGSITNNVTLSNVSGPGLTIGNLSSLSNPFASISVSSDWDNPNIKRYEVLEITEDLLALGATWQRLRKEAKTDNSKYVGATSITDKVLFDHMTPEDRQRADTIRDYYSKKIVMWNLKGVNLSKFRQDMSSLVHSDGKVFKENIRPIAYRLPEFYDYDMKFDEMVRQFNRTTTQQTRSVRKTKTLTLQNVFLTGTKYSKRKEFWFTDEENNLVTFTVQQDNILVSLLEKYAQNPIEVLATFNTKTRDGIGYLIAEKFSFN
jgi:hypothetical protein